MLSFRLIKIYINLNQHILLKTKLDFLMIFSSHSSEDKNYFDHIFEESEVIESISKLKNSKSAGPDGLPIDIYKLFKNKLFGPLKEMYAESFQNGYLPPTLRNALITLILKPPTKC